MLSALALREGKIRSCQLTSKPQFSYACTQVLAPTQVLNHRVLPMASPPTILSTQGCIRWSNVVGSFRDECGARHQAGGGGSGAGLREPMAAGISVLRVQSSSRLAGHSCIQSITNHPAAPKSNLTADPR